ncbi:peptidoglycan bridge formation glycyltransferase FemA/FemB family protein [Candidatus Saccharibacteria bacterium]|nr:peptidoglycan bridge formation glycyltransferase FemA/FemB family protein [Candidatus Saccharibacteria bacterium]
MSIAKKCDEPGVWDEVIHDLGGHPLQLWGWGELKATHKWSAHRILCVDDSEKVIGAAQLLVRPLPKPFTQLVYAPRGPVWRQGREQQVVDALATYATEELGGVALTIEPDTETLTISGKWRQSHNRILLARTLILDLTQNLDDLQSAMTKKTRQYIRKSSREGLYIRRVRSRNDVARCVELYHDTAQRARFALHDDAYYYDVHEKLGDSSVIFAAFVNDEPVAFVWLAVSSSTAFELYGGMNDKGQTLRANYALKWHAIKTCKEWGIGRYDMNGLLNDGVSGFKQGFAHHETQLVGTYDYPLSRFYEVWAYALPVAKRIVRRLKKLRPTKQ